MKRLYACAQIRHLCFSNYRIRVKYSGESCESLILFVLKIDCSVFKVTITVTSFKNIVTYRKKRLKPNLGNSNVHRQRNLDRERSASQIVSYRARIKYACARIRCTFYLLSNSGESHAWNPVTSLFVLKIDFSPNIDEVAITVTSFFLNLDRWGPSPLPKKGAEPPIFGPCLLWPNDWMEQDGTWHRGGPRRLGQGHNVLDGDPTPLPQKGQRPQFSAHVYCGQRAERIKTPVGKEVKLDPRDFVLDGLQLP